MLLALLSGGCLNELSIDAPEPIRPAVEPELGGEYLLYRPSIYDRNQAWPLIVVCHGRFGDSPAAQIRHWASAAESQGFLVVAPKLASGRGSLLGAGDQESQRLAADERHILKTIRHVQAAHTISPDRIFIYGYGSGVSAAMYAGLRNADVFRAVALVQPKINDDYPAPAVAEVNVHQPVLVAYSTDDAIRGRHGKKLAEWLFDHAVNVRREAGGRHRAEDVDDVIAFFESVIRKDPWALIVASPASDGDPLSRKFSLRASFDPAHYLWEFGDGEQSPVSAPEHRYGAAGTYRVQLTVTPQRGEPLTRSVEVRVP
ncbi:MAG: PKD domain-containing protein [Phycisphaerae bacterium]|nr:PKD domain-containing protein [Phycisphaerae bacterium]